MAGNVRRGWFLALALAALGPAVAAQEQKDDADGDWAAQLQAMQGEMQLLRADNERMQDEIDRLRVETSDNWLTETRADEIRTLVSDVLADADLRTNHLQNGLAAGWSEHFYLASPDGRFKLQLDGQIQTRFIWSYHDQRDRHRSGYEVTRSKLTLRGNVFGPDVSYLIRTDHTRNEPGLVTGLYFMQDVWIGFQLDNEWSLRAGQFKLPYNREELISSSRQMAVERSLVNENMNIGRSQGVELSFVDETAKFMLATSDGGSDNLGGFGNLLGTFPPYSNALDEDVEWAFTTRYELKAAGTWNQFTDFTSRPEEEFGLLFGLGGHFQQNESNNNPTGDRDEHRWVAGAFDVSAEWGGASAFFSIMHSYVDNGSFGQINITGVTLEGAFYMTPKVEVFARWEYGWWRFSNFDFSDLHAVTLGVNYYIDGHDLKWTTDIGFGVGKIDQNWEADIAGWRQDADSAEPQVVFRTQFQLLF
ncbi:MAG: hypothetical protein HKO59_10015 [Phycisphaerales bacterium]|nr:OprO/OprP family phosphate-selective porin [Phycisphaerae bacterium]NNF44567.1 hypothetical protein [Phycisphaerales bacterium]NNM26299.1 hypothetical protein [Phycisphaerales bacterium]